MHSSDAASNRCEQVLPVLHPEVQLASCADPVSLLPENFHAVGFECV